MKKELITLRIALLIGLIIVGTVIAFGAMSLKEEINKESEESIKTQMLKIQAKAKIVFENYHINQENGLKGEKVEEQDEITRYGLNQDESYYKWNQDILNSVGLSDINVEESYYLVNYETEEVVYSNGYKLPDGTIYYKLSDIKKLGESEEIEKQDQNNDDLNTEKQGEENDGEGTDKAE